MLLLFQIYQRFSADSCVGNPALLDREILFQYIHLCFKESKAASEISCYPKYGKDNGGGLFLFQLIYSIFNLLLFIS